MEIGQNVERLVESSAVERAFHGEEKQICATEDIIISSPHAVASVLTN